ncbi:hypothetical protein [Streptomyces cyaneochromogenes]|uniref:hypothetical protein n=1 Tax=Streptomyces cyaneochromogenes TaxID=2496836 RepID=UPI001E457DA9|nr:hypothetical protein [Streptomyces cyaneochromogenes]
MPEFGNSHRGTSARQSRRITPTGVMPRRPPAWTKEQYQNPSVYGVTLMPSGVRLVFRTDARELDCRARARAQGAGELDVGGAQEQPRADRATIGQEAESVLSEVRVQSRGR